MLAQFAVDPNMEVRSIGRCRSDTYRIITSFMRATLLPVVYQAVGFTSPDYRRVRVQYFNNNNNRYLVSNSTYILITGQQESII